MEQHLRMDKLLGPLAEVTYRHAFSLSAGLRSWIRWNLSPAYFTGWASLVSQTVKNPPAMYKTRFNLWVGKIPWRREQLPTPVFLPGKFHGQRNLAGYSPWGHRVGHHWATFMSLVAWSRASCLTTLSFMLITYNERIVFLALCDDKKR